MLNAKVKHDDENIIKAVQSHRQNISHIQSKDKYLNGDTNQMFSYHISPKISSVTNK